MCLLNIDAVSHDLSVQNERSFPFLGHEIWLEHPRTQLVNGFQGGFEPSLFKAALNIRHDVVVPFNPGSVGPKTMLETVVWRFHRGTPSPTTLLYIWASTSGATFGRQRINSGFHTSNKIPAS